MIDVKLQLLVTCFDIDNSQHIFLLDDEDKIIIVSLTNSHIFDMLSALLEEYLEIHSEYVIFKNISTYDKDETLYIVYGVLIPSIIKKLKGKWKNIGDIYDELDKRIIYEASQVL